VLTTSFDFTTSNVANETPFLFNAPNYLIDLTKLVKSHPKADLMVIRANYPYAQFDPNDDHNADQQWRMVTYDWTDRNRDRRLFTDRDRDGTLDEVPLRPDRHRRQPDPRLQQVGDPGRRVRALHLHQPGDQRLHQHDPLAAEADGRRRLPRLLSQPRQPGHPPDQVPHPDRLLLEHRLVLGHHPSRASGWFTARIRVPSRTPYGLYDGALVVSGNGQKSIVPVAVTVTAVAPQDADGNLTGTLNFGGAAVARAQRNRLYNNGSVFDAKDWGWRAESGDWRFYYFDVLRKPPAGTQLLADTTWPGPSPHNDIDTLVFGKVTNTYQLVEGSEPIFAPYALGTVGGSQNTNAGAGVGNSTPPPAGRRSWSPRRCSRAATPSSTTK
jgi:hypothetical protein